MKFHRLPFAVIAIAFAPITPFFSSPALADNIANCEAVLLETIKDENGNGGAKVASYRPATDFMESVYTEDKATIYKIDGLKIQAIMCKRFDIIPTPSDFKILETGVPFFLSQSFESRDSDLLSFFFKDGAFRHNYKGPGLSKETEALLLKRLAIFNAMDHDLVEKEAAIKSAKEKLKSEEKQKTEKTQKGEDKTRSDTEKKTSKTSSKETSRSKSEQSLTSTDVLKEKTGNEDLKAENLEIENQETENQETENQETIKLESEDFQSDSLEGHNPDANTNTPDTNTPNTKTTDEISPVKTSDEITTLDETTTESISSTKDPATPLEQSNESE